MNLTAREENIERLTNEVREAKQECLAFFVSLQVSAEELRQNQEIVAEVETMMAECRSSDVVVYQDYCFLKGILAVRKLMGDAMSRHLVWDSQLFSEKVVKYRKLLTQFNLYLEQDLYIAPVLEFRHDNRRSNHPPTH